MQARYTVLVVFMDDYPVCCHNRYGSLGFSWLRVLWNVDHRTDILSCIVVVVALLTRPPEDKLLSVDEPTLLQRHVGRPCLRRL